MHPFIHIVNDAFNLKRTKVNYIVTFIAWFVLFYAGHFFIHEDKTFGRCITFVMLCVTVFHSTFGQRLYDVKSHPIFTSICNLTFLIYVYWLPLYFVFVEGFVIFPWIISSIDVQIWVYKLLTLNLIYSKYWKQFSK